MASSGWQPATGCRVSEAQHYLELLIDRYLRNWTVIQLILSHGFAGELTKEKINWLTTTAVPQVLLENDDLCQDEVEYYLSDILFHEFDTVIEDGSLPQVSQKLLNFYTSYKNGNVEELQNQLQGLTAVEQSKEQQVVVAGMKSMQLSDESSEEEVDDKEPMSAQKHQTTDSCDVENDKDGWQIVQRRRRNRRT